MANPKILITGGAGYIGSALAERLIQTNKYQVTLWDNYTVPSHIKEIGGQPIQHKDVRDKLDTSGYDIIFHLAAISGIARCNEFRDEAYSTNVRGTFNLLRSGFRGRIIFASTSAVYGVCEKPEINETHIPIPESYYGETKLLAENAIRLYDNYTILRFSNIYGKGIYCKRTVADRFIERAIKDAPLEITGDGRQRRDFVHVADTLRAYFAAMRSPACGIYNVGGNEALSVNDIATLVEKTYLKVTGVKLPTRNYIPQNADRDWKDFIYSSQLAKDTINYEPMCSMGDEIRERINAYSRRQDGKISRD